ncbi:hypothetical protein [Oceanobacillus senegalensis]|uniref:hypothetical protein n=1 Tax=Oceanobacillus senegalensis TaxID=1936063 RepID=UPI001FE3C302|nr:hypothetical protein [Oceanobacillus senegalensis]
MLILSSNGKNKGCKKSGIFPSLLQRRKRKGEEFFCVLPKNLRGAIKQSWELSLNHPFVQDIVKRDLPFETLKIHYAGYLLFKALWKCACYCCSSSLDKLADQSSEAEKEKIKEQFRIAEEYVLVWYSRKCPILLKRVYRKRNE